jgi:hypothetical protein
VGDVMHPIEGSMSPTSVSDVACREDRHG